MALVPAPIRYAPAGMVCSFDHLATTAGIEMLAAGGTAADAAVAASAVLAVTSQFACGMGGDLFALVHAGDGPPACLNASGRAGSGADPDRARREGARAMPFRGDIRSVPVPGCVDGWLALHRRFGTLPIADVLGAATGYAADGFPATPLLVRAVTMLDGVAHAEDYTGAALQPGALVRRPGVARALEAIADQGRTGFYEGRFGEGLIQLGQGEYEPGDLAHDQADWVEPISVDVWGHRVWTVPPNSQGYVTLSAAWIAAQLDLPGDSDDPRWPHLLVEAVRQASHDRGEVLHEGADGPALLAPDRLAPRAAAVDPGRAAPGGGPSEPGGTIYLCAVDERRMGVSLIQSNAAGWGSLLVEPSTGIFLQNRGIGFSLEPGHPAEYGPRRRPPHTLAPALVTHEDGRLAAVIGTEGGDTQPQVLLQLLNRLLHRHEPVEDVLAAPRWVLASTATPERFGTWEAGAGMAVRLEDTAPAGWADGLRQRGHTVETAPIGRGFGNAHAIVVGDGSLTGGADPRSRAGSAAGY